jgi:polysaccharide export outer membrane protein
VIKKNFALFLCILLTYTNTLFCEDYKQYEIREDDLLSIIIYPAEELGREVVVQPDGNIELNLIGSVKAAGLTAHSLAKLLELRLASFVKNPQVSVIIKRFSGHQVFITGAVKTTGSLKFREGMKIMELVSLAGGATDDADIKKIRIIRGEGPNKKIIPVNLDKIMNKGLLQRDILIEPGDVVFVPKRLLSRATWFLNTITPWLTLINTILLIAVAARGN